MNPKRPNIIYVFPDQMRAQSLGVANQDPVFTPNLDRFAAEGTRLTHCVSNFPVCSPHRAMLMTGKYPFANGVVMNCNTAPGRENIYLKPDEHCLTDVLAENGYDCGYIGKWHLERPREPYVKEPDENGVVWNEYIPPDRRHGINYWHGYNTFDNHFHPEYWIQDAPRDKRTAFDQWSPEHEADVAIEYLRNADGKYRDSGKPFALIVSMNPPHNPYHLVPQKYVDMYGDATSRELLNRPNVDFNSNSKQARMCHQEAKNYFACVTGVDDQFGRILACLKEQGLEGNTIVVFTSDHGDMMGSHNLQGKPYHYDEAFLVPFIIRWPGRLRAGAENNLLMSTPDIMPTLLGLAGLDEAVPPQVQGQNLQAALRGGRADRPESSLYLATRARTAEYHKRGLRNHRYTLMVDRGKDGRQVTTCLHDNKEDPYQMVDVSEDRPDIVRQLKEQMVAWLEKTGDPWHA